MSRVRPSRVEQSIDTLMCLKRDVMRGSVAPASFQRPYVWNENHVEALWASIVMGIPVGAVLLWRPDRPVASSTTLGPIPLQPWSDASLILDGNNRLTTIAWSSTPYETEVPDGCPGFSTWRSGRRLVADTIERRIRFVDASETDRWLVPMHHVGNSLQSHLRKVWIDESEAEVIDRLEWLDLVESGLLAAKIVVTTLYGDETAARAAYLGICSAGVPMSPDQLEEAIRGCSQHA